MYIRPFLGEKNVSATACLLNRMGPSRSNAQSPDHFDAPLLPNAEYTLRRLNYVEVSSLTLKPAGIASLMGVRRADVVMPLPFAPGTLSRSRPCLCL